jgi:hypothetical protein
MVDAYVRELFHFAIEGRHVSGERVLLVLVAFVVCCRGSFATPRQQA